MNSTSKLFQSQIKSYLNNFEIDDLCESESISNQFIFRLVGRGIESSVDIIHIKLQIER